MSTDPAHSTSDVLGTPVGSDERTVLPGLQAVEIDPDVEARRFLDEARSRIAALFSPAVVREAARHMELTAAMPGVADVAAFGRLVDIILCRESAYDLIVVDTAPTGQALRLLRMPELMGVWIRALADRRREAQSAGKRDSGGRAETEATEDPVVRTLEERSARLDAMRRRLTDPGTSFVLVMTPERLPIEETARATDALAASGLAVSAIVVNRVLPEAAAGPFYAARKAQERVYLDEIDRRFSEYPRVRVPQFTRDVHGIPDLLGVAGELLA